ncbi:helicase-related protein [Flavobacterium sp. H122]|uniref:helicase-related protein n=1 Tax=Flavobacterium sp. H122 TaxID=2529860 RepID=UPI0010AAC0D0|nr:helicase-related protein [Flavobacterium sp. H122]
MDRVERTVDIAKAVNAYNLATISDFELVNKICSYFDYVKNFDLSQADKSFMLYLANKAGIPHYFDMLAKTQEYEDLLFEEATINASEFAAFLCETSLYTDEKSKLHRYQKEILNLFIHGQLNRYFLSASTSFGKTHLTYEVIKKMKYKNIILIFPTVALLTENLSRLKEKDNYSYFAENGYALHTLSDGKEEYGEKNIFIFTPERYLSFLDKKGSGIKIDFVFVDEVYKIDNEYMDNDQEELKEHDRDLAYRMAIYYALLSKNVDLMLAGPYITFYDKLDSTYNESFDLFLSNYNIKLIDKNDYEIVGKELTVVKSKKKQVIDGITVDFTEDGKNITSKPGRLRILLSNFLKNKPEKEHKTIVYCSTKVTVENYANSILSWQIAKHPNDEGFNLFIDHLERVYNEEWCVIKALKGGVGIHHGVVPKYIQKEIIKLFNTKEGGLTFLVCTTTITEGVNTSAKNLIALFDRKGSKPLKAFDAKNIAGRAGRFMEHFQGSVISIQNDFDKVIDSADGGIKHKNFDVLVPKNGADLDMTEDVYLGEQGLQKKKQVKTMQEDRGIPDEIIQLFKTISKEDKITIYDRIKNLGYQELSKIQGLIQKTMQNQIDFDGFQVFIETIKPIVRDKNFLHLLDKSSYNLNDEFVQKDYSRITYTLYFYLKDGFNGLLTYRLDTLNEDVDTAMRKASELVYNTFKYQLVKYLGVFNTMYKYYISKRDSEFFDDVSGLDRLLTKLEYNAFTDQAKIASDYGVPQRIIDYYDAKSVSSKDKIKNSFDSYENHVFNETRKLFEI